MNKTTNDSNLDSTYRDVFHYEFKRDAKSLTQMDCDKLIGLELESGYTGANVKELNKFLNGVISGQK